MTPNPLTRQVGGSHYQTQGIQPIEFIERNGFPFSLGCAIKYVCRWRLKGGVQDLEKAIHYLEFAEEYNCRGPRFGGSNGWVLPLEDFITSNKIEEVEADILRRICTGKLRTAKEKICRVIEFVSTPQV